MLLGPRSPVGRFILDLERIPNPGSEAATAVSCFERVARLVPGAQAIVYDTALRGVHHQKILREMGIVPVNTVAALETSHSKTTTRKSRRREKTVHVGDKTIRRPDGTTTAIKLARAGRAGAG